MFHSICPPLDVALCICLLFVAPEFYQTPEGDVCTRLPSNPQVPFAHTAFPTQIITPNFPVHSVHCELNFTNSVKYSIQEQGDRREIRAQLSQKVADVTEHKSIKMDFIVQCAMCHVIMPRLALPPSHI